MLAAAEAVHADVTLPKLIGDHMVLQRDTRLVVWGWAQPQEHIRIDFRGKRVTTRADRKGRWSATIGAFQAGGPYDMVVVGQNQIVLHDILIGDVWLASGQSNMEVSLGPDESGGWKGVNDSEREIAAAYFPDIRLFKVHRKIGLAPAADVDAGTWTPVTPASARGFSAVAYFFGRELHQRYHVPVGLIDSSWGGTVAEAWVSEGSLKQFPEFQPSIDSLKSIDEPAAIAEDQKYHKARSEWYERHGAEDRGRVDGVDLWAASDLAVTNWATIDEPQTKAEDSLKGFDGVVWLRKEVELPSEEAGKDIKLHLAYAYKDDTTFFNGQKLGESQGGGDKPKPTEYLVPGNRVRTGRNVIVVRLKGSDGFVGLFSDDLNKPQVAVGDRVISLAGKWLYQPGPDLYDLPAPSKYSKLKGDPNTATLLFNGMVAPLVSYMIRGVIWYQGESNAIDNRSAQYRTLFPALIKDWRRHWGYQFPFLFVQLAGWPPMPDGQEPGESPFAELREAQSMALALPATAMATAIDQPEDHPKDKQTVGHRLLLAAAKTVYGEDVVHSGPVFKSMQIEGNQIRIRFSSVGSGLQVRGKYGYARGFEIAGADGKFQWAQARQDGGEIVVLGTDLQRPVAVRYDWSNTPDGNLYNAEGLPALPFRTDEPMR
jgi:sialate O-acetylesterase